MRVLVAAFVTTLALAHAATPPTIHFAPSIGGQCAREVGVSYTYEEGATEELGAFNECVARKGGQPSTTP